MTHAWLEQNAMVVMSSMTFFARITINMLADPYLSIVVVNVEV